MKKNRRYRRSFSQLNKFITQAKVTEFTDDQDIILELDDKKKRPNEKSKDQEEKKEGQWFSTQNKNYKNYRNNHSNYQLIVVCCSLAVQSKSLKLFY